MKAIKRLFKFIFGLFVTLVVAAVLLVLALPFWIGPVAKTIANRTVPDIVGTNFRLGEFGFNFYTGKLRIGDIKLENPDGYSPKDAFTLGRFNVDLDVGSLFDDTIVVHEIALRDMFVSYVKKDGKYNLQVIADNVQSSLGGECEGGKPEQGEPRTIEIEIPQGDSGEPAPQEEEETAAQKKVIIDRVEISGITVQWGPIPLPVPKIVVRDIGRESGGVTWEVAWREICAQVINKVNSLGQGLVNLGEQFGVAATNSAAIVSSAITESSAAMSAAATETVDTITTSAVGTVENVKSYTSGTVSNVTTFTSEAVDTLKSSTTNTANFITVSLKDGTSATVENTTEALKVTTETTSDALKATGEATIDALKATGGVTVDTLKATGDSFKSAGKEIKSVGKDIKNMFKKNK